MRDLILLFTFVILCFSCKKDPQSIVQIVTELGEIDVEIFMKEAPRTASNFLKLVDNGVYEKASFYRVVRMDNQPDSPIKIEVIQGGLKADSLIEHYDPIIHETTEVTGIKHLDGVISMARMEPGTASTEIFICVGDQPELDFGGKRNPDGQGFAAFGKVIKGMDVVREIQSEEDKNQMLNTKVEIEEIVRIKKPL